MGYARGVRLTVNLVGTKQSYLVNFAQSPGPDGKRWLDPLSGEGMMGNVLGRSVCSDTNIQMPFQVVIANLNEAEVKHIIVEIASKMSRAFNQQSEPRCFVHGTREFPWQEYHPQSY